MGEGMMDGVRQALAPRQMAVKREADALEFEFAINGARRRAVALNREHERTNRMTPDARVNRWLSEAPGAESEDVVDLLRDLQVIFRAARARADVRRAKQRLTADERSAQRTNVERLSDLGRVTQ